ncbi:MAG: bifunctional UDP-N-acetylglucosamine diphosphorylase/glucosamine-1-phosphate N-acetyltransferase GlmU [Gammaproteobacteria bacterium]|nr:bifunctional UDP-N-acetylglucosamine diphosphorylase/glucosamine-1-phosphate N-acetyltransferase GlmU [Gammaproteobacteria bacterium]MBU2288072.1 bifunctional UDP-N-acetylglucosamine diphosphorylase/glucosamine-1-phosphate N-acetyltransferase GlmU [Gammaproteobacteria bacterium]MBU2408366.1 bifunctional UDP-N-acetylglucosamine diphosphorylase/glucosamine-1-phosphate N-acetyltransferase GlmU [Gammaproteobacteria bacterium]
MKQQSQDHQEPVDVVIMAAGKGTRMKSSLPKVLHRLGGRALVSHVIDAAMAIGARNIVVVTGHGASDVEAALAGSAPGAHLRFARQVPQLGTGHALQQAAPLLPDDGTVVVLSGDVPLIGADTLRALVAQSVARRLALLTIRTNDPTGYGRILRARGPQYPDGDGDGEVQAIVEQKDATESQREIDEVYSGVMALPARLLKGWLTRLDNKNAQGEYYLTDVVGFATIDGVPVVAHRIDDAVQVAGVNTPAQLAALERALQRRRADALLEQGVRLADPARIDVRGTLVCESDVEIDINCIFEGAVSLGAGVRVGAHCIVANARIETGAVIEPFTHIDGEKAGVTVGASSRVGPFARLRPGARLGPEVHIGNFVEVKNSTLGAGAKANHLAYLGDATVGARVNYGAGSITANYDGANKHRTVIGDDVHVGSNCVLVAPVTIGAGGTVGGGTTVSKSTAPGTLTIARARQISYADWQRPKKV